jgi:predicted dehydrogenase
MNPTPYRAAVIGHTGHGNYGHGLDVALVGLPGVEVVAVADPDDAGRLSAVRRIGAPRDYADYRRMLADERPDLVAVAPRWCDQHEAMVIACVEAGVRGIYCEKPLAATPAAADRILAACAARDVKLVVAHRSRENPYLHWARRLIEEDIGPLQVMRGHGKGDRRAGAEDTMVLGTHVFDQMRYFAGDALWCTGHVTQDGRDVTAADVRDGPEGMGPIAGNGLAAYYAFGGGVTAHYESYPGDRAGSHWYGLELHCARGIIALRNLPEGEVYRYPYGLWLPDASAGAWERVSLPEWEIGPAGAPRSPAEKMAESNRRNAQSLLDAVAGGGEPIGASSGRDALAALEMVLAPAESQRLGRRVDLPLTARGNPYATLDAG